MRVAPSSVRGLAALLAGASATHFLAPGFYDPMVPAALPGRARAWTYGSGVAELAVAAAVAHPHTRRRGAQAAAALFVAVFPANLQMALDARRGNSTVMKIGTLARLPLQLPLVAWAVAVANGAR